MLQDLRYPKVTQLHHTLGGEKHILDLNVSVEDLLSVEVLHGQAKLGKPLQYLNLQFSF
jgi:hypothetical protein